MTLGNLIRAARERAGLSLAGLGLRVGLSPQYIHDIEHGRRPLLPMHWRAFIDAFPLDATITTDSIAHAYVASLSGRVTVDAQSLTPEQRRAILELLLSRAASVTT